MIGPWRRARDAERALEVAETDRDIARAQHGRDLDTIAEALGVQTGPGLDIAAGPLAQVITEVRRQAHLAAGQRDRVEAELLAVDEALAAAGVDWTDDRAAGIRDLATGRREARELVQAYRRRGQ